jgi:hypothetical protein
MTFIFKGAYDQSPDLFDQRSSVDASLSMPGLDQMQQPPVRAKKRVAFKEDERLPRSGSVGTSVMTGGAAQRGRMMYGSTAPSVGRISPSTSPTRNGARTGAVRGRQSSSVGRLHTSL